MLNTSTLNARTRAYVILIMSVIYAIYTYIYFLNYNATHKLLINDLYTSQFLIIIRL